MSYTVVKGAYAASFSLLIVIAPLLYHLELPTASALSFYTALNLSNNDGDSSNQQVTASGSNVYVVWNDDVDDPGVYDIFFARSTDNGASFDTPINLSANGGFSFEPQVAVSGTNVYVVWHDDADNAFIQDIFFARSTDNGASFDLPVNLSLVTAEPTSNVRLTASGNNVYMTWQQASDVFFSASNDGGFSFSTAVNLSNSGSIFSPHSITSSDNNVYVVWDENDDVFLTASVDEGITFGSPINVSNNFGSSGSAQVVASGNDVYVVWDDDDSTPSGSKDIFFSKSTDNGANFSNAVNVAETDGFSTLANMMLTGNNIYIVWQDEDASFVTDVLFVRSTDGGSSFEGLISISANDGFSNNPKVATSGVNVYVVWDDDTDNPGMQDVFFSGSTDGGTSFGPPINVSNSRPSLFPRIAASDNILYIIWMDFTSGFIPDVFVRVVEDTGPPSITIETVSDASPKWGSPIQVSGTANADNTYKVVVDWGDGAASLPAAVVNSAWGPIAHTYDSAHTGNNFVVARLLDEFDVEQATSAAQTISVQKHATALTLNPIMSVIKGSDVTATGALTDTDTSALLNGKTISFTGTGATNLASTDTASDSYSSTGTSPSAASALLTVQAHFAGDDAYLAADSVTISYDTVEPDAATFAVSAGTPSEEITLTGFDALIRFENVPAPGSIFVSTCDSPPNGRYAELASDLCIHISPVVEMAPGTAAHITISYDSKTLPSGHTQEEIGIFRESISGITEITESRNVSAKTVTGKATGFGRFIVGVALHDPAPAGAKREQVFVGDNNVSFDFTEARSISLSKSFIAIGSSAIISVTDALANLNSSVEETISAIVTSTSDPTGITVTLQETGPNTGIFTRTFAVTSGSSSAPSAMLHAQNGNSISATYEAMTTAPFHIGLTNVSEAGLAEVVSFTAPASIIPVGDAYELSLRGAKLSPSSTITLTMSYANAQLQGGDNPSQLRIVRVDGTECKEVVTPTLDTVQKTVTGTISALGQYTIAFPGGSAPNTCPGVPGGGGGGLPRPGSGLVLDAVAVATVASSGGGGSSSSRSTALLSSTSDTPVSSNNTSTTANVNGETVNVAFDSVEGSGSVNVVSMNISQRSSLFSQITETGQGMSSVDGSPFSTAGKLFNVSTTALYSGPVQVTIPYNESMVSDEQKVRFLHYGEDGWEDATISIDTQSNTVTGQLTSLSPVVAGIVEDETFGETYFVANPTKRMAITDAQVTDLNNDLKLVSGGQVSLQATVNNSQRTNQTFTFIVQVLDEDGFSQSIRWQTGDLGQGKSTVISSTWTAAAGTYKVKMFIWTGISEPMALSEAVVRDVVVN